MKIIDLKCPACGASITRNYNGGVYVCEYCDTRFIDESEEAAKKSASNQKKSSDNVNPYQAAAMSTVPLQQFVQEQCKEFLKKVNESEFEVTDKCKRGLNVPFSDQVYLMHDDTLFKNGKNGFAITDKGFYCRELMESANFVSWEDFAQLDVPRALDGTFIKCGGKSICYFTGGNDVLNRDLLQLIKKLQQRAKLGV